MKNKQLNFGILTLLIVAICVGLIIFFITKISQYTVDTSEQEALAIVNLNEIFANVEKVAVTDFNGEKAKEIADAYVNAVNEEDWATVAKYSSYNEVENLIKYQISDMHFVQTYNNNEYDYNLENDEYVFFVEFSFETQNKQSIKEIGVAKYFIVKAVDGIVSVNPLATNL